MRHRRFCQALVFCSILLVGCSQPASNPTATASPAPSASPSLASGSQLQTLDLASGKEDWSFAAPPGESLKRHIASLEDKVFVETGVAVYALDERTGQKIWRAHTEDPASASTTLFAAEGKVFCSDGGSTWALDAKNGEQLWKTPLPAHQFVYVDKTLGLVDQLKSTFAAVDPSTGKERWKNQGFELQAAVSQGKVFLAGAGQARSLQVADGKETWKVEGLSKQVATVQACGDGVVVVNTWEGLRGLSEATGKQVWASKDWGYGMCIQGDRGVVCVNPAGGNEGPFRALCLSLKDGKEKWSIENAGGTPYSDGQRIVLGICSPEKRNDVTAVLVVDGKSGQKQWVKSIPHHFLQGATAHHVLMSVRPEP